MKCKNVFGIILVIVILGFAINDFMNYNKQKKEISKKCMYHRSIIGMNFKKETRREMTRIGRVITMMPYAVKDYYITLENDMILEVDEDIFREHIGKDSLNKDYCNFNKHGISKKEN